MKWIEIKKDFKKNFTFGERIILFSYAIWFALASISFVFPVDSVFTHYYVFYVVFIGFAATPIIVLFLAIIMGGGLKKI